jgi:hypothetical protein
MRPIGTRVVVGLGALLLATPALAQTTSDHLSCYRVRDSAPRARYSLTLTNAAGSSRCRIKAPAVLACLETVKSAVSPAPPGGGPTGATGSFLCYALKCGRSSSASTTMQDQFGSRTVTLRGVTVLCAPATHGTMTTTPSPRGTSTTVPGSMYPMG